MIDTPIMTANNDTPGVEVFAYECKFSIECRKPTEDSRIEFDGYANNELIDELVCAIAKVTEW